MAKRQKAQNRGLVFVLIGAAVFVVAIWAVVWLVLPKPDVPPHAQAEAGAISALREAAGAVSAYEERQGTYPNTIEEVSSQATAAYAAARTEGYTLLYRPGSPGSDGNIHTFVLLARPEYYGYANYYIDQTGVVRSTRQNRAATVHDRPIS